VQQQVENDNSRGVVVVKSKKNEEMLEKQVWVEFIETMVKV
jgi:hypothetical protein